jgi:hypothetical protein
MLFNVGSPPGLRYSLCIERSLDNKCFLSDVSLINDIYNNLQVSIGKLRNKFIYIK